MTAHMNLFHEKHKMHIFSIYYASSILFYLCRICQKFCLTETREHIWVSYTNGFYRAVWNNTIKLDHLYA